MQEQKAATLTTIFFDVLADLAFMFTDDDEAAPSPAETWLETTINYNGTSVGNLTFRCSRAFTVQLAANLLGIDVAEVDDDAKADDAVKEFMNIVCGQLITALHGTDDVFNLSIPKIRFLDEAPDFSEVDGLEASTVSVEGEPVQLTYQAG